MNVATTNVVHENPIKNAYSETNVLLGLRSDETWTVNSQWAAPTGVNRMTEWTCHRRRQMAALSLNGNSLLESKKNDLNFLLLFTME